MMGAVTFSKPKRLADAAALFGDWPETILWSVLQEKMGSMYVDHADNPKSAAAVLGDFVFLAGTPSEELILFTAELTYPLDMCIYLPQNEAWEAAVETAMGDKAQKVTRYATEKNPEHLCRPEVRKRLEEMAASVPDHFEIKPFNEGV